MNEETKEYLLKEDVRLNDQMELTPESKDGFFAWVHAHRKQLIATGISIVTIIGLALAIKNRDALVELWLSLAAKVKQVPAVAEAMPIPSQEVAAATVEPIAVPRTYTPPSDPFDVRSHLRMLPANWHHSAEKAAEAAALGIELLPNQTIVDTYPKYAA